MLEDGTMLDTETMYPDSFSHSWRYTLIMSSRVTILYAKYCPTTSLLLWLASLSLVQ